MFIEPARHIARINSGRGRSVYQYRFSYVAEHLRDNMTGAEHSSELPFIFNKLDVRFGDRATSADKAEAALIHEYWVNFAKSDRPSSTTGGAWQAYAPSSDRIMIFDARGANESPDPFRARLDFIEHVVDNPDSDSR